MAYWLSRRRSGKLSRGGWHADWVRCPQASLARRSFVCRARGRELGIAMAVAKLYLARMLQRTLPAGLNGDDLGREPIEFNARGGALPDCLVNTHHYCPGDNPLKMALRSILRSCVWCPDRWSR